MEGRWQIIILVEDKQRDSPMTAEELRQFIREVCQADGLEILGLDVKPMKGGREP